MMITKTLCTFALTAICLSALQAEDTTSLRVMTLNLYHGGTRLGQPLSQSVKAIQAAKADIVGLQETENQDDDSSVQLARMLKWHHFVQGGRTSVISRYPIVGHTPKKWGVHIKLPTGIVVHAYNVHFHYVPFFLIIPRARYRSRAPGSKSWSGLGPHVLHSLGLENKTCSPYHTYGEN